MNRAISIDWLTMYCESPMIVEGSRYEFKKRAVGGKQFAIVYDVYDKECNEKYCIVQSQPHSPIIPKNAVMVQVCNRYLYYSNWNITLCNFMSACNIHPKSISRIDIACDFNRFAKGIHPSMLINRLVSGEYRYVGRSKVAINGELKKGLEVDYLRVGNRDSEISCYLYNKSKELREAVDKPYIREMWSNSGLDIDKDVWRLEVSLSNVQMRTIVVQTGEMLRLDLDFLKTQGIIENVYHCAVKKAFDIRKAEPGKRTNKMDKVLLFDQASSTLLMTIPTSDAKTNRMDRILVKRLANCHSMYRTESEEGYDKILGALEVLLENEALREYYYEKVVPLIGFYKER